jgi:hypothetical protein
MVVGDRPVLPRDGSGSQGPVDAWLAMDISLDLVIEAARRRLAAITPEGAGYIVLLATQQLIVHPCRVLPADLLLQEDGDVRICALPRASEQEVEAALRTLLATLLALSPSPAPAISAVVQRPRNAGLHPLAAELSAALIPINHAAARRALARLYRETRRAGGIAADGAPPAASARAATDPAVASGSLVESPSPAPTSAAPALSVASEGWAELDIDVEIEQEVAPAERVPALPAPSALELHEPSPSPLYASAPPAPESREVLPPVAVDSEDLPLAARGALPPLATPESVSSEARLQGRTSLAAGAQLADSESWPPPAPGHADAGSASCRSNIRELLASYLSQTRAEEPMTRALREMIGLLVPPFPSDAPTTSGKDWPA